jgi:hypothetical protein
MSQNKRAYFQGGGGVNEPEPKKKKYKSDKAITVQPRFKEPFYRNYDVYETEGVDGAPKLGPGAGWHHMNDYKSIQEFLAAKRKHMKDKYKADDTWIEDNWQNHKERTEKMKTRASLLNRFIKTADHMMAPKEHGTSIYNWKNSPYQGIPKAPKSPKKQDSNDIDFPIDDQIGSGPILGDSESYSSPIQLGPAGDDTTISPEQTNLGNSESYPNSAQIGGLLDKYLPQNDFEGKSPDELDFGRDYTEDASPQSGRQNNEGPSEDALDPDVFEKLLKKYTPAPTDGLYGLPDGVNLSDEDLGDPTDINPDYGTTDVGTTMYEDKWNI